MESFNPIENLALIEEMNRDFWMQLVQKTIAREKKEKKFKKKQRLRIRTKLFVCSKAHWFGIMVKKAFQRNWMMLLKSFRRGTNEKLPT